MKNTRLIGLGMAAAFAMAGAASAFAGTVTVDCGKDTGQLKGIHRGFSGGFVFFAEPDNVKPYVEDLGAKLYRWPVLQGDGFFQGHTLEDARNPEMYNFEMIDGNFAKLAALGMRPFPIISHVPSQLSVDGTDKGFPKDLEVYTEMVKHLILHATQGWGGGTSHPIEYWEIWNEPDLSDSPQVRSAFFTGTQDEFFQIYASLAKMIRSIEPLPGQKPFKVGGPAFAHLDKWHEPFLAYCDANALPLDFFSFHHYDDNPEGFLPVIEKAEKAVRQYERFRDTELILDEWNLQVAPWGEGPVGKEGMALVFWIICNPKFSSPEGALHMARTLMLFERSALSKATHFLMVDNGISQMGVITCPEILIPPIETTGGPKPEFEGCGPKLKFHVVKTFETFSKTPQLLALDVDGEHLDAMAGRSAAGDAVAVLLVNSGEEQSVDLGLAGLPWDGPFTWTAQAVNQANFESGEASQEFSRGEGHGGAFEEPLVAPANSVLLVQFANAPDAPEHTLHSEAGP